MKTRRIAAIATLVACAAAVAAAIAGATASRPTTAARDHAARGGVYRVEWESSFDFTSDFDPTGEYSVQAFGLYSNLLVRTLVGYNHVAGPAGNALVPDLATSLGTITHGGRTYTFRLKPGIRFGPPLNRAITSKDVAFAFERIGTKAIGAQYGFYYDVIKGMAAFAAARPRRSRASRTPDARTIVFNLTAPTGDFRYRLAMPAAGPMPREVAGCFTQAGRLRPLPDLVGPVHDRGLGQARPVELHDAQRLGPDLRLRRRALPRPRAQPRVRRAHRQPEGAREPAGRVHVHGQLEHRRHLRARRERSGRRRGRAGAADGPAPLPATRRSSTRTPATSRATSR